MSNLGHRRGDAGGVDEEVGPRIQVAHAFFFQKLIAAADERRVPRAVLVEVGLGNAGFVGEGAGRDIAHCRGFGEDLLHPCVGLEGFALFDADRGEQAQRLGVHRRSRLLLHDRVDVLKEGKIDRANGVEVFACGPTKMLKAVAEFAKRNQLPCQVSLEEHMACAVGGCAGCVVPYKENNKVTAMKRVCVDGPIFSAENVY